MEEAANQIEHLENKLEQQKVTFEEKLIKAETELSYHKQNQKKEPNEIAVKVKVLKNSNSIYFHLIFSGL